jgi:uncharacterized protein (TIGR02266 family)
MAQDTRKDTRAPVSLKVRFKSATVDEFIEQYSTDISRGGIFIKSKAPMPVGTLLKFEFELKDNSPLIHGVGRVVWKRDLDPARPDMPPGMGIKFIKMDSQSRAVVERIVGGRPDSAPDDHRIATPARPQVAARAAAASSSDGDEEQRTMVSKVPELMAQAIAQMPGGKETVVAASPPMPMMPVASAVAAMAPPPASPTAEAPAPPAAPLQSGVHTVRASAAPPKDAPPPAASGAGDAWAQPVAELESDREALAYEPEPPPPRVTVRPPPPAAHVYAQSQPAMAAARRPSIPPPPLAQEPNRSPFIYVLAALLFVGAATYLLMNRDETPPLDREAREGEPGTPTPPTKAKRIRPTEPAKAPDAPPPPPPPAAVLATVRVETTPPGAQVWVGDASKGPAPVDLHLPAGQAVTVKARKAGYREASQEVTPAQGAPASVSLALEALPRVLAITSEPAGASITIAGRLEGRTPKDVTLGAVTEPILVRLTRGGSQPFSQTVALDEGWSEVDGQYRFELSATLTAAAVIRRPPGGGGRPPRGGGTEPGGGGTEPGGGGTEPGGGGTEPGGGGAEPGGGGTEPGGGGTEPGGGGTEPPPPPPPPPPNNSPVPDNPFGK